MVIQHSVYAAEAPVVLVWGDSLSAAYGIPREKGWVALMKKRLDALGMELVNGSVSGETTGGGLQRMPAALKQHQPILVILELGANDGLRGLSVKTMQRNLDEMIKASLGSGAEVLLLGMKMPPNYGIGYTRQFEAVFIRLEEYEGVDLIPFFLRGVATDYDLIQADGLHPTSAAQPMLLDNIWPSVEKMLAVTE